MVAWARKYGIQSTIHTGGPSIPGSGLIDKDVVLEADTDVIGHINGGHTALPDDQIVCICEGCHRGLEIVHNGNERAALYRCAPPRRCGQLERVILGTDAPAGSGVQPLGIIRMISMLSSLGDVPAEIAFCFATGNTARMRDLDCGLIEAGRAADFVLMDKAQHSAGRDLLHSVQLGDMPGHRHGRHRRRRAHAAHPQHAAVEHDARIVRRLRTEAQRNPSSPLISCLASPPTRGCGRPESVTATATTISLSRGASLTLHFHAVEMTAHEGRILVAERNVERRPDAGSLLG